jgi:hypothetical protein
MGIDTWEKGASLEDKGQEWYLHTYRPRLQATTSHLKEDRVSGARNRASCLLLWLPFREAKWKYRLQTITHSFSNPQPFSLTP